MLAAFLIARRSLAGLRAVRAGPRRSLHAPCGSPARTRSSTRHAFAAGLLALALAGCATAPIGSGSTAAPAGPGALAPALAGTTLDGATLDLASFRGRPVIVNFWASWCVPCRDEFPLFRDELALHTGDGLAIVGVVFKDDDAAALGFQRSFGASWPSLTDHDGAHARDWRIAAPPQTYFIDRNGIIQSRQIGEVTKADFERQLAAILR